MVPISLRFQNFFSHKDSVVDFSLFNSALIIGNTEGDYEASNGCGKSSSLDAILWALFAKSRVASADDVIFWGENQCSVSLIFKHKETTYKIVRTRDRVQSATTVNFYQQNEDGSWSDISGSTASLTNKKIIAAIKCDYKTFINSVYFRQNDISEFTETDPAGKKEILKSIIDISKWDEFEKDAKLKSKSLKNECAMLSASIEDLETDEIELSQAEFRSKELDNSIKIKTGQFKYTEEKYESLHLRYLEMKQGLDTVTWDKTTEEIERLKKDGLVNKERLIKLDAEIKTYEARASSQKATTDSLTKEISSFNIEDELDDKITKLQAEQVTYQSEYTVAKTLHDSIKEKEIVQGICHSCGQEVSEQHHQKIMCEHNEKLELYNKQMIYSKNKLEEVKFKLDKLLMQQHMKKKRETLKSKLSTMLLETKIAEEHIVKLQEQKQALISKLNSIKTKIEVNNKLLESLKDENFQKIHEELSTLKKLKYELAESLEKENREFGILTQKISSLKEKIDKMKAAKQEMLEKSKQTEVFQELVRMFGKNGIQTLLLNEVIEDLEKTSNDILSSICHEPFSIRLETQRVGSDGESLVDTLDLIVKKDGITQNFKSLSGGEQFRVSLALRIALSEISSRHGGSSLEFLLLDEVNSPLDKKGTDSLFVNVIKSLEQKYKILVITHNDSLKEKFDNVIDVTKINGESFTTFISR